MTGLALTSNGAELGADLLAAGHALADVGEVMRDEGRATLAAAAIPRDTGALEDSAAVAVTADGFALTAGVVYAGIVHARNPFFARALAARESAITAALVDHADTVLRRL